MTQEKLVSPKTMILSVIGLVMLLIIGKDQYNQKQKLNYLYESEQKRVESNNFFSTDLVEIKMELRNLKGIKEELRVLAYNVQRNPDLSGLHSAKYAIKEAKNQPLLVSPSIKEGKLVITIGEEIKKSDTLFGASLRGGKTISNHGMRTSPSYNGELPHPLADQFILILYRQGTFQRNGQTLTGIQPIGRWTTKLTPVDKPEIVQIGIRPR